jgi:hypothetical protein
MAGHGLRLVSWLAAGTALLGATASCRGLKSAPPLAKPAASSEIPRVPVPPADGPKLGALADVTPILERPATGSRQIGYLHAGAQVARAGEPYSKDGCPGGWYPVRPRGFVCAGEIATTNLGHPTLVAMSVAPKLGQTLPYAYARSREPTKLYRRDPKRDDAVVEAADLAPRSAMAVVGSWSALLPDGKTERLALLTNGTFVKASVLSPAEPSGFQGQPLSDKAELPMAFLVKRGVHTWKLDEEHATKLGTLDYHAILPLSGRFRTLTPLKYWALDNDRWLRHRDATVVQKRNSFPDFATGDRKWIDVSVVTGTAVLYEGHRAVFVTLVSVGRDRMGDPKQSAATALGDFEVVGKHVTARKLDPKKVEDNYQVYDVPWAIELSSGQYLHGTYWHDRFGIENGPGNVELSPADAQRLWQWVEPTVPDGWHGVSQVPAPSTMVRIRK